MRFKEFFLMHEDGANGNDKGLMGFPLASSVRKPSDGQPFKQWLGSVSGQTPRGGGGGAGPPPMKMKKK